MTGAQCLVYPQPYWWTRLVCSRSRIGHCQVDGASFVRMVRSGIGDLESPGAIESTFRDGPYAVSVPVPEGAHMAKSKAEGFV